MERLQEVFKNRRTWGLAAILGALLITGILSGCISGSRDAENYNADDYLAELEELEWQELESLKAEMGPLRWPDSEIAALLPKPDSDLGKLEWSNDHGFVVYVGDYPKDKFYAYVDACKGSGFNVDGQEGDDYYYSDNADGYDLSLNYEGDDIVFVRVDAPQTNTPQALESASQSTTPSEEISSNEETVTLAQNETQSTEDSQDDAPRLVSPDELLSLNPGDRIMVKEKVVYLAPDSSVGGETAHTSFILRAINSLGEGLDISGTSFPGSYFELIAQYPDIRCGGMQVGPDKHDYNMTLTGTMERLLESNETGRIYGIELKDVEMIGLEPD